MTLRWAPLAFVVLCLIVTPVIGKMQERSAAAGALTNADVVKMTKAGLTDEIIVEAVRARPNTFDLSVDGLLALRSAGVSNAVIKTMQAGAAAPRAPAPAAAGTGATPPARSGALDRAAARSLISRHEFLTETIQIYLAAGRRCQQPERGVDYFRRQQAESLNPSTADDRVRQESAVVVLVAKGLVARSTDRPRTGECGASATGVEVTEVTAQGQAAATAWKPAGASAWQVPIAQREIVEVTGVRSEGGQAMVEFSWRWKALLGDAPRNPVHAGVAHFAVYDDGWRIDESRFRYNFMDTVRGRILGTTFELLGNVPASPSAPAPASAPAASTAPASAATAVPDLRGRWSGSGNDDSGPGTVEWAILFSDPAQGISGTFTSTDPNKRQAQGDLSGSVDATGAVTFTMAIRKRRGSPCEVLITGEGKLTGNTLDATYTGEACGRPVHNGRLQLTKQQ